MARRLSHTAFILTSLVATAAAGALLAGCSQQPAAKPAKAAFTPPPISSGPGFHVADLYHFQNVSQVELSPDGHRAAYTVGDSSSAGRPSSRVWIMDLGTKQSVRLNPNGAASLPHWSPDGQWIAFQGSENGQSGLWIAHPDGSGAEFLAPIAGTNAPLPGTGNHIAWSPDGKQIAYVSATPGPEVNANGDPHVITRYLYKPTASEGVNPYNDNRRLHIFLVQVDGKQVKQLTSGDRYEHSIQWSPKGDVILYASNAQKNPDQDFNYDLFTVNPSSGEIKRLTDAVGPKYDAVWSPDGAHIAYTHTIRPITSMETTGEDTHLWVMNADGSQPHRLDGQLDQRYRGPVWSADGAWIYSTVQDHGLVKLVKTPMAGGAPTAVIAGPGSVGGWSLAKDGTIAYAYATPQAPASLYIQGGAFAQATQLTNLNQQVLSGKTVAPVVAVDFKSFDGTAVEAFLTEPADLGAAPAPHSHPLILQIHGGPHGQQGPEFNSKAQIYASHGYASLMVNYRGSTGYGQAFEDKILKDQDGGEAKDVLAGLDAAIAKYNWIDPNRLGIEGGSYGGQLADWLITQTPRFKAAIPTAGISNLISFNYLSYYHDYLPYEYEGYPNTPAAKDALWQRSALRYVNQVKTPVLFIHGANDNDVPTEQAQEYFIALKDVGVETTMLLYPREGHGLRETRHVADATTRSMRWYDQHFASKEAKR